MALSHRALHVLRDSDPKNRPDDRILFHPTKHPEGLANLGCGENRVVEKEVEEKLKEFVLHEDEFGEILQYSGRKELGETRKELISYFSRSCKVQIEEEQAILLPTCTAAFDLVTHVLLDPHDVILTTSPAFLDILVASARRGQFRVEGVPVGPLNPDLRIEDYARVVSELQKNGDRVRAIVIVHPHNPIGWIATKEKLIELANWAASQGLFVVFDEILSGTVSLSSSFTSALSFINELHTPERVVWMSSLAKDLGSPGLHSALVVSPSETIRQALLILRKLTPIPPVSQLMLTHLLKDCEWVDETVLLSRKRLDANREYVKMALDRLSIPYSCAEGGLTLLADFSQYIDGSSYEAQSSLTEYLTTKGVFINGGVTVNAPSPGWFRIAYARPREELKTGVKRLFEALSLGRDWNEELRWH